MKSSVLLVDETFQTAKVLRNLLWGGGYEVQMAADGDAALTALRGWSPSAASAARSCCFGNRGPTPGR